MLKFSLIFLALIVCFIVILRVAVLLMGKIASKYVERRHRAAEAIINTGKVPKDWTYELERKIIPVKRNSGESRKILEMEKRAKDIALKRVDHLIDYFETSPFVKDKESREILLGELQKIRGLWEEKNWEEIITS